ncbi:MAG: nitrilase-related carbon-nitrogen hydrolase [Trueperaceae bacterium]
MLARARRGAGALSGCGADADARVRASGRHVAALRGATDIGVVTLAAALLALSGIRGGPWWAALAAGGLLWPRLVRARWWRAAPLAAIGLLPVPAIGYEGLRVYDPPAWWAVSAAVAVAYGAAGAAAAGLAARLWPAAPLASLPLPWLAAWSALDLVASHAQPWSLPPVTVGYALVGGPLVALAALAGPTGLGVAWGVLGVALAGLGRGAFGLPGARAWWPAAAALALAAAALQVAAGAAATGPSRSVAVLQVPDGEAPGPDRLAAFAAGAAALPADLHVWPEAALARELADDASPLHAVALGLEATVLAGAFRRTHDGAWRNAAALADRHGALFAVDKRLLVPGYEDWLTPGIGERWPLRAAGWRLGVLICWESLFLDEAIERVRRGADVLVVLAHDGWANGTGTPWWHARAGRLVAWSVGRPVVVASHDGPSMVWGFDGRALAEAGPGAGALLAEVAAPVGWRTPYVALGPGGLAAVWGAAVAAWIAASLRAARSRQRVAAGAPQ